MKENTLLLILAEIMLGMLGLAGLLCGEVQLAYAASGACAALLAGHLNGTQVQKPPQG